ncbi:glycoside hydrolase family 31 protein [Desertivirga arenae]|uniref:glycoside hydrolase family 31 protein n=1 Tax=Desertivirga arenae TaxID=2810309 RepID=UPI001A961B6A|nr:TIM-barrel domain-containing protein [Pedobacter sp. SYSU D00823]
MRVFISIICLLPSVLFGQTYKKHLLKANRLSIDLSEGVLNLIPLTDKVIRVSWEKDGLKESQELVLVNRMVAPKFKFAETATHLKLITSQLTVLFSKKTTALEFINAAGKVFLSEKPGGRKLIENTVMGERCFIAEQSFVSPSGESLFGLGQFQDGNYNLRNVSRKLTQVNTQIAIPFLYSSNNYGILWHQYGLTDYNPTDNYVNLVKRDTIAGEKRDAEVTTTAGTQQVSQQQSVYKGTFNIPADGEYSIMLDLGDMDNRHLVVIDGKAEIDQSNLWLPPSAGKLIKLKAGTHEVQIVCKASNTPRFSWESADNITTFRSPNAKSLDYIVFAGRNADEVIANYRNLSGNVPMLPLWAYGFWQCRERYTSGNHLVETVKEFRRRNLPVDVIVQDWQYWGKYGWGVPKFDEANYPDPANFIKQLHDLNARFSVSVWENLDRKSEVAKEYVEKKLYIPNSPWIDIYNPETQKTHWKALNKNLFSKGVDSWWMDATEPENDALKGKQTYYGLGDFYRLTYPLLVSRAVYQGQRTTDPSKRVAILTRSAFPGQQRYGTINWSGDIGWNWDTFKRQIVAGLNFNITGMPYWTTDIGGFFRPGRSQYTDEKYHDILTRWFQWGVFNPIFRIHGYQSETEPWKYGEKVENNMRSMLNLRYMLLPYIYSQAWQVSRNGSTIMRPMVMDFASDEKAVQQGFQYMFGKSMLVAPVTEAEVTSWNVYLPKNTLWYDYWTGRKCKGGQTITADAPQDKIPVFIKAGSIIPIGQIKQYSSEKTSGDLEIRIYPGANGSFQLYEDEGDNYNYEKGHFTIIPFSWNDSTRTLGIGNIQGSYPGYLRNRTLRIFVIEDENRAGNVASVKKTLSYHGKGITVSLN